MATVSEAVRRLTLEAQSRGVKEATRDAQALSNSVDGIAVSSERAEKATTRLESRFNSIQRRYDEQYRAQAELARVDRELSAAQAQGLVTLQRRAELLSMAAERHGLATSAIIRETQATEGLERARAAANDNQWRRRNLTFQLFDVSQTLAGGMNPGLVAIQQGPQIAQLYAGQGGVNAALKETGSLIGGIIAKFPVATALIATGGLMFAGLTYEINQSTKVAVGFGDVVAGTFEALAGVIYEQLQPAIAAISPWFSAAWDGVISATKYVGNAMINTFRVSFETLKLLFTQFPNIVAVAIGGAANVVVAAVEAMINFVTRGIDLAIKKINDALASLPDWAKPEGGMAIKPIGDVKLGRVPIEQNVDALRAAAAQSSKNIADIMNDDPLGDLYDRIRDESIENALDKKKKAARDTTNEYERMVKQIRESTDAMKTEAETIGMTVGAAAAHSARLDLLRAAKEAEIPITAALTEEINKLADAYAKAAMAREGKQLEQDLKNDPFTVLADQMRQLDELLANGSISWETWADAAIRAKASVAENVLGLAGQLTGALGKLFGESKAWAIAEAIINTAQAITKTLATYGATPWGLAAAAVAAATGAAQIATITRTNKGAKSAPSMSGGGGGSAANNNSQGQTQQAVTIQLQGDVYSRQSVEDLIKELNDASSDGHKIIVKTAAA